MIKYQNILERLSQAGYTTYYLRQKKILSEGTIGKLRVDGNISTDTINKICNLLQCQPSDIMTHSVDEVDEEWLESVTPKEKSSPKSQ